MRINWSRSFPHCDPQCEDCTDALASMSCMALQMTGDRIKSPNKINTGLERFCRFLGVWPFALVQCSSGAFQAIQPHLAFILGIHSASARVLKLQSLCRFSVQFWLNVFKGHRVYVAKGEHSAPGLKTDKTISSLSQGCHASAQNRSLGETGAAKKGINVQKVNWSIPTPTRLLRFPAPRAQRPVISSRTAFWIWLRNIKRGH